MPQTATRAVADVPKRPELRIPCMSLGVGHLSKVQGMMRDMPDDDNFKFKADANWWRCLTRFIDVSPEGRMEPTFEIEFTEANETLTVNRGFLRSFMAAWTAEFPITLAVAISSGGVLTKTAITIHGAVWHEILLRSVGHASEQEQRSVPDGCCLAHSSVDPNSPPVVLAIDDWNYVCTLWPSQFPDGKKKDEIDWVTQIQQNISVISDVIIEKSEVDYRDNAKSNAVAPFTSQQRQLLVSQHTQESDGFEKITPSPAENKNNNSNYNVSRATLPSAPLSEQRRVSLFSEEIIIAESSDRRASLSKDGTASIVQIPSEPNDQMLATVGMTSLASSTDSLDIRLLYDPPVEAKPAHQTQEQGQQTSKQSSSITDHSEKDSKDQNEGSAFENTPPSAFSNQIAVDPFLQARVLELRNEKIQKELEQVQKKRAQDHASQMGILTTAFETLQESQLQHRMLMQAQSMQSGQFLQGFESTAFTESPIPLRIPNVTSPHKKKKKKKKQPAIEHHTQLTQVRNQSYRVGSLARTLHPNVGNVQTDDAVWDPQLFGTSNSNNTRSSTLPLPMSSANSSSLPPPSRINYTSNCGMDTTTSHGVTVPLPANLNVSSGMEQTSVSNEASDKEVAVPWNTLNIATTEGDRASLQVPDSVLQDILHIVSQECGSSSVRNSKRMSQSLGVLPSAAIGDEGDEYIASPIANKSRNRLSFAELPQPTEFPEEPASATSIPKFGNTSTTSFAAIDIINQKNRAVARPLPPLPDYVSNTSESFQHNYFDYQPALPRPYDERAHLRSEVRNKISKMTTPRGQPAVAPVSHNILNSTSTASTSLPSMYSTRSESALSSRRSKNRPWQAFTSVLEEMYN